MYRPPAYAIDDVAALHAVIRARIFATIAGAIGGRVHLAYAPVMLDPQVGPRGALRFHLARANPLAASDGATVRLSFLERGAYISPDWYETGTFVPTWNYVAVEGEGRARRLDERELRQLLIDISAAEEERLRPKKPWTLGKLPEERIAMLLSAIRGFEVPLDTLEGKFKLSQEKSEPDRAGAIAGLEARGDADSLSIARAMRACSAERREE